jgi:integrase
MKIRAEIRPDRLDKKGLSPIRFVVSDHGKRKYLPTELKILPPYWDDETGKPCYISDKQLKKQYPDFDIKKAMRESEVIELEARFQNIRKKVNDVVEANKTKTIEAIIEEIEKAINPKGTKGEPEKYVFDYIDSYIESREGLTQRGSMVVYKSLKNHLRKFQEANPKRNRATFENVDHNFLRSFQKFLHSLVKEGAGETIPKLNNVTVAKQLSCLKTFLNYARKEGLEVNPRFKDFSVKKEDLEVIALTSDEFERLFSWEFDNARLNQVKDIFCFSCVSGFRYSDLDQLRWDHIKGDYIKLTMIKTAQRVEVPLNPYSLKILARYQGKAKPLPMISNVKANLYIKEACKISGIDAPVEKVRFFGNVRKAEVKPKWEFISMHSGRKTFATLSLKRGMSAEVVMAIGGWKDYKSFKRYIGMDDEMIREASIRAWGEPSLQPKLRAV